MRKIYVGSDHAGMTLKNAIRDHLKTLDYDVIDIGAHQKISCHYPDFAKQMFNLIKQEDRGILVCGSGIGIAMAACKAGLPCSTAYNEYTAKKCGEHCLAMAIGERVVPIQIVKLMLQQFLQPSKC